MTVCPAQAHTVQAGASERCCLLPLLFSETCCLDALYGSVGNGQIQAAADRLLGEERWLVWDS